MMSELERLYSLASQTMSDINEHCPKLRELATGCRHVVEFGMRRGVSTTALLAGQPENFTTCDINCDPISDTLKLVEGATIFKFIRGDSLILTPIPCDLLFIDTQHTERQVYLELCRHAPHCSGKIAFHDTETFGERGEDGGPGIMIGIRRYMVENPEWEIIYSTDVNNGLTVIEITK